MLYARKFALIMGIVLLALGVLAFIPGLLNTNPENLEPISVNAGYGYFLNFLPVNILNKVALIVLGIAGIVASRNIDSVRPSIVWSRWLFAIFGLFSIMGMFESTDTFF